MRTILPLLLFATSGLAQGWLPIDGPNRPGRTAAHDWRRDRVVIFAVDGATWEIAGGRMLHRPIVGGPPGRARTAMVYDSERRHVLMFGGVANGVTLNDTWTYDGVGWTLRPSASSPSPRVDAGIAYDSVRQRVVLAGGQSLGGSGGLGDIWEHDGASWQQRQPATPLSVGMNSPLLAFDEVRGVTVMVVEPGILNTPVTTWEWDGIGWRDRTPTGPKPLHRSGASLAHDPIRGRTVLLGGSYGGDQIWEWDGAAWTHVNTVADPVRLQPALYFDRARGAVVMLGGAQPFSLGGSPGTGPMRTDQWTWNGSVLTRIRDDFRPSTRFSHAMFSDPTQSVSVMFGGTQNTGSPSDTWTWDGIAWTQRSPAQSPAARANAAATFDLTRRQGLLFGGWGGGVALGDLWAWDGTNWLPQPGTGGPSARQGAGLAYDLVRGVAVLFGGAVGLVTQSANLRNDTWEWNGTSWLQRTTPSAPSARERPAMAYDLGRSRIVLFGGRTGATANDQLADTWEFDGNQWTRVFPAGSPPALASPTLQYDLLQLQCVLAGLQIVGQGRDLHLWRYDGTNWVLVDIEVGTALQSGTLVLHVPRQRAAFYDGQMVAERIVQPAVVAPYGAGCGNPTPALTARTRPRLGDPAFGLELQVAGNELVGFAMGLAQGSVPIGNGCTQLLANIDGSALVVATPNGLAEVFVPLPGDPVLFGFQVFAQAVALDPATTSLRLSQGLRLQVGN